MADAKAQQVDRIDVRYVANLARLDLTPDEVTRFQGQLDQVIAYFQQLKAIDVAGVEPTAHAIRVQNVFRADEVRPSMSRDRALANAPAQADGQFLVPRIVE